MSGPGQENITLCNVVRNKRKELCKLLQLNYGFLDQLISQGCCDIEHINVIENTRSTNKCRRQLVKELLRNAFSSVEDKKRFLEVLKRNNQRHLALSIEQNGRRFARSCAKFKCWPLDTARKSRIARNMRVLVEMLDPDSGLVREWASLGCINYQQCCDIEHTSPQFNRNRKLLNFLLKRSVGDYDLFVECLRKRGQRHLAEILEVDADADRNTERRQLNWKVELKHSIEFSYGLLDDLMSVGLIKYGDQLDDFDDFEAKSTSHVQRSRILDLIGKKSCSGLNHFLAALTTTGQEHVVEYIKLNGCRGCKLNKCWPLDPQLESRLTRNMCQLIELIRADVEFVTALSSSSFINSLQECDLKETRSEYTKTRKLLNFLLQSSIANYENFVECLKKTSQHHLAPMLENNVVVETIDITISSGSIQEETIVERWKEVLNTPEKNVEMQSVVREEIHPDVHLIEMNAGHSVRCYMLFRTPAALNTLYQQLKNGSLTGTMQAIFNSLLGGQDGVQVDYINGRLSAPELKRRVAVFSKDIGPPGHPINVLVDDVTKNTCRVTWEPPETESVLPVTGYIVERLDVRTMRWTELTQEPVGDRQLDVSDLIVDDEYEFRVCAVNSAGSGEPSEASERFVAKNPYDVPGKPGAPCIKYLTASTATVEWKAPVSDGGSPVTQYVIEMRAAGETGWSHVNHDENVTETWYDVRGIKWDKEYEFRVTAANKAGRGEPSAHSVAIKYDVTTVFVRRLDNVALNDVGLEATFECEVTKSDLKAEWFKDGKELEASDENYWMTSKNGKPSLTIKDCQADDVASYTVKLGRLSSSANLTINGAPTGVSDFDESIWLTYDVLEPILLRVAVVLFRVNSVRLLLPRPDVTTLVTISSVCRDWCDVITGRRILLRRLKETFKKSTVFPVELFKATVLLRHQLADDPHPSRDADVIVLNALSSVCRRWKAAVLGSGDITRRRVERLFRYTPQLLGSVFREPLPDRNRTVMGATMLGNYLYVLHSNVCNTVQVFDCEDRFKKVKDIEVANDMSFARDMVGCDVTQQLFISDLNDVIWRVDSRTGVSDVFVRQDRLHSRLFLADNRLLVTSDDSLLEFDVHSGDMMKRTPYPEDLKAKAVWHAVESNRNSFFVIHGTVDDNSTVSEIYSGENVVTQNELRIRMFNNHEQLHCVYLALLGSFDGLLVAIDNYSNKNPRVILLDSHLKYKRILLDAKRLDNSEPWRMNYNKNNNRLAIGLTNGEVKIFECRPNVYSCS